MATILTYLASILIEVLYQNLKMKVVSLHKNYQKLIHRASKGQRIAQYQLFEIFAPKMLSICRQYVKNNTIAEEVMLSGFLKVFIHLKSFKFKGSFEGWIRRIMINEAISQLRRETGKHN